jgi:peptidoglycan/LPS O-acetylase OafA/YrhL
VTVPEFGYRTGLTHLRALSVVLVLLFHAGVIDSGYIGVDVFFVLSGFLISNILWDKLTSDRTSGRVLVEFYRRRCLRILPLSLLVLAVTAVAAHLWFDTLIDDWVAAGRAATVWWENWFLIGRSDDYFAPEGTNPFQHYWSLAVEEQFYVVLPLVVVGLLLVLRRFDERVKLLALAGVATAGAAVALASYRLFDLTESEFYYSSFSRSYQLLTGVVVMALVRRFDLRDDRRWLFAVGVVGLVVVGGVLSLSVTVTGVLATACAAACVLSSRAVLVESRWLERLGLWSYGIYLWHFPINAYLTNERLGTSAATAFVVTLVASSVLAATTFRFFEDPVRRAPLPSLPTFATVGAVILVLWLAIGQLGTSTEDVFVAGAGPGDQGALAPVDVGDDGSVQVDDTTPKARLAAADVQHVEGWVPLEQTAVSRCGGDDLVAACTDLRGDPTVLLIGDSFANQIYQGLRPLAEEHGWGLAAFVRPGCPWMDDVYNDVGNDISDRCASDKPLFDQVLAAVDPDVVVIHNFPYRELNRKMTRISTGRTMSQQEVADAATATVDRLEADGREVVFVEPTPYPADGSSSAQCLQVARWADECDFEPIDVDSLLNQAMRARAAEDPDVWFTSIDPVLCQERRCASTLGDVAVMADRTHTSGGIWVKLRRVLERPLEQAVDAA